MDLKHVKILVFSGIALIAMIIIFKYTLRSSKEAFNDKPVSSTFNAVEDLVER